MSVVKKDIAVIGAGVLGLSIAHQLLLKGYAVTLLEKEDTYGKGNSSRNSNVIHSGVYYAKNSLRSKLSLKGKALLYQFCEDHQIPFKQSGKLFVAVEPEDCAQLSVIKALAQENGIEVRNIGSKELQGLEPQLKGIDALLSPTSGFFDGQKFMSCLYDLCLSKDFSYLPSREVVNAYKDNSGWTLEIGLGHSPIQAQCVINASGVNGLSLSKKIFETRDFPILNGSWGAYMKYQGQAPFKHIIYPSFTPGSMREIIVANPSLDGFLRFGPSYEPTIENGEHVFSPELQERFYQSIKKYFPTVEKDKLIPDVVGLRPRLSMNGQPLTDWMFEWQDKNTWLDLWGFDSPALTASLAIGDHVAGLF